jgi:hypothetical protein
MIFTNDISDQSTATDSFGFVDRSSELINPAKFAAVPPAIYHIHINRLVQQIDSPELRRLVGAVFQDLLRLLECVQLVENYLRQVDAAEETFALFHLIHDEARKLVESIRTDALKSDLLSEELADTLDGITFALNHDLHRVFDSGPKGSFSEKNGQLLVGKLYRAHDVLINCLQQSTITLAIVFDPELVGTKLFNNSDMRYRQSLQLCQDLSELIKLIEESQKTFGGSTLTTLIDRVEKFRSESMECLMYSDWPQFETFCERIDFAKTQPSEVEKVLHQFRCYLETLLGQVRMRNVFADVFPLGSGEEDTVLEKSTENTQPVAAFHPQDKDVSWGDLASVA